MNNIRNFAIIAHVDHGKSTLADRLLEFTNTVPKREMVEQILDSNPIERERGITIKLAPVRMIYHLPKDLQKRFSFPFVIFNLIDTPGHADFSYEVSRSLASCEGVILVVDATQGIQAQTLAYMEQVKKRSLKIIPVINKIDLPLAKIDKTKDQLQKTFGFKPAEFIEISAKRGTNINLLAQAIIERIPAPCKKIQKPLRMLVFSSIFKPHQGVVCFVRVVDGQLNIKDRQELIFMASNASFLPLEIGYFSPKMTPNDLISAGEVGYIATGLKDIHQAKVGDTITLKSFVNTINPLPGYQEPKPFVFLGLFPLENNQFANLRESIEKLHLSDSAFTLRPINSPALGNGFHCGFLGKLHADIVHARLEREFNLLLIKTFPHVQYLVKLKNNQKILIENADGFPPSVDIQSVMEPIVKAKIYSPQNYLGQIMELCKHHRGKFINLQYLNTQIILEYILPLSELIFDFFDKLKSITNGYATLDYEVSGYQEVEVVKLEILVHYKKVDALSLIIVKDKVYETAKKLTQKLKGTIPRHNFEIPIQAAVNGKIIARENIKAYRKDVTAKLYGGDRTRKDKLLDIQKEGKKKMKLLGRVNIPKEAFLAVLTT